MNKNFLVGLAVSGMLLGAGNLNAAQASPAVKEAWKPVEMAKDAKPVVATLMNKGAGHENWIIKQVSACDQNNVWCVASDGMKEAVFQLTSRGLEHRFDGVYVSSGKGVVTVLNEQHEVFELPGGTGKDWKKIENLKLSKISRPTPNVGWGLFEREKGKYTCYAYNDDEQAWEVVKDNEGQPAEGLVDLCANAEAAVLALNDKGELLKGDLHRKQMYEKAKEVAKQEEKAGKGKGKKGKKGGKGGKGKKGKKAAADMIDANHDGKDDRDKDGDGKISAAEQKAYDDAHKKSDKKGGKKGGKGGKGKKGKKAAADMIDANHDGKDDRDTDGDGKVSAAEQKAYDKAHKKGGKKGGKGKKGKKGKKGAAGIVDANHDGKDDRDTDHDGKVSAKEAADFVDANKDGRNDKDLNNDGKVTDAERAKYAASHK